MRLHPDIARGVARLPLRRVGSRRVLVHGFYGMGNVGDDAILEASRLLFVRHAGVEPTILGWNAERVTTDTGLRAYPWRSTTTLKGSMLLARSSAYLVGGGGVLKDFGRGGKSTLIPNWLAPLSRAQDAGIPTATWFVGVENIDREDSRSEMRRVLNRCHAVSVRDRASGELLRSLGVTVPVLTGPDPVTELVSGMRRRRRIREAPVIGVCLRNWQARSPRVEDPNRFDAILRAIATTLDASISEHGATVEFIPFRRGREDDDVEVALRVQAYMTRKADARVIQESMTWKEAFEYIDRCDIVLAMRLHALIAASAMGIPVVALEYMPKVTGFMDDAGLRAYSLGMEEVVAETLGDVISTVIKQYDDLSSCLVTQATHRCAAVNVIARDVLSQLELR
jgi:polysaccharide pyruvyl transferase CsaB